MNLPIDMTAEQSARLDALIQHGDPDLLVLDQVVNGAPLYLVLARGRAREWAHETLTGKLADAKVEELGPLGPPPPKRKPVISTGVRSAEPGQRGPN